jgi:glycerol-3-phosphate dehydrogenase (NAD(P)+)
MTLQPLAILGAGSFGTALALYLARREQHIRLWTIEKDHAERMAAEKVNARYLSEHPFPSTLLPTHDLAQTLKDVTDILIAVPSVGFRHTLMQLKPFLSSHHRIVWVTKGLDEETGELLHEVVEKIAPKECPYAILSGPSFAREVASGLPTAVVIASKNTSFANDLVTRFNGPLFRVYLSTDIIGVEIGGTVKNILAIATGISDGMRFGANARCALITRGLTEMTRLGVALGALPETFTGLSGLGDLILTCTDDQSRNRRFGLSLGKGKDPITALREIGQVVEGKHNTEVVLRLAKKINVDMPITQSVETILEGKQSAKEAMIALFSRTPKTEAE